VTWGVRPGDGKVSHTYALAGTYTVKLTIAVADKSYTETKTDYIHVYALPHADFSASATGILLGEAIAFTNTSTGGVPPLAYAWDFDGDGTTDSTDPNPTHSYLVTGTYTVSLKVTDARGNSTTEKRASYISVGNAIAPHVVPPQGGIIQTADGLIAMTFPAGAVSGEATVSIEEVSPPAAKAPGGFQMGSSCFTVRVVDAAGDEIIMFSRLVTVTVKYSDEDVAAAGGALKNLVLAYYNEATGKWKIVETTPNSTDRSLSATTTHFSTWAILVQSPSRGTALWIQIVIGIAAVLGVAIVIWKLISVKPPDQMPNG
jgi:PKD repeat protein